MILKAGGGEKQYPFRRSESPELDMFIIFKCKKCDNVWSPEALLEIYELEELVKSYKDWEQTCFAESSTTDFVTEKKTGCAVNALMTPLVMFQDYDLQTLSQSDVTARVQDVFATPELWRKF